MAFHSPYFFHQTGKFPSEETLFAFEREGESFSEKEEKIPASTIFSLGMHFEERKTAREGMKI